MAVVSAIQQQQKRQNRYSIYIDDEYRFSLSEEQLLQSKLTVRQELTTHRIAELVALSDLGKAIDRVYNLLSYRDRSVKEVRDYLKRKDYDDSTIEQIINYLVERSLLDDNRFATTWVQERRNFGLRSRTQLQAELRQKGIASDIIAAVVAALDTPDETATVVELIQSRKLINRYPDKQKLTRYLAGKGFQYGVIKDALKQLEND
jgi:regulatory protein